MLEDQKDQMATLKLMDEQNIAIHCKCHCCNGHDEFDYEKNGDSEELVQWLRQVNTDEQSIKKV